jgi:hypothetical protein
VATYNCGKNNMKKSHRVPRHPGYRRLTKEIPSGTAAPHMCFAHVMKVVVVRMPASTCNPIWHQYTTWADQTASQNETLVHGNDSGNDNIV